MSGSPTDYLDKLGRAGDGPHDIATAALMLAALDHPGLPLAPFRAHLDEIADAMKSQAAMIARVADGARALAILLTVRYGYDGDRFHYQDPRNADLISVIERRRGLPVSLGILYMHAARAAGMTASGLNTQNHFLVRLTHRQDDVTLDPFNGGAILEAGAPLPAALGDAHLAQTVGDTEVLLRLQNNLKIRALEHGNGGRALEIASRMVAIAPGRAEVWFDFARLNEEAGVLGAARKAYERALELTAAGEPLYNETVLSLSQLKRRLN